MSSVVNIPTGLIDALLNQKCVVFVGAGLSRATGVPDWKRLVINLLDWAERHAVAVPDRADLEQAVAENKLLEVVQEMRELLGKEKFRQFMTNVFRHPGVRPTENHLLLSRIPFAAAVTTNYENLVESGYTQMRGVTPHVFTHEDTPELSAALRHSDFFVLKAHGTIDRIETIILSREDYRRVMHSQPAYRDFLKAVFSTRIVLFIGFSLTDPDLLLLLDELRAVYDGYTGTHYALMDISNLSSVERRRFAKDYGIEIIPYTSSTPAHSEVTSFLKELGEKTDPKKLALSKLLLLQKDLDDPDFHFIADTRGSIAIAPKDPEAYEKQPLTLSLRVEFDTKTLEGREAREKWLEHQKTGVPLTISAEHIKDFSVPEPFRRFADIDPGSLQVVMEQRPAEEPFLFRVEAEGKDGRVASIDYLQMYVVRCGTEEVTLSNDRQPSPLKLTLVLRLKEETMQMNWRVAAGDVNVRLALQLEKFFQVISQGGGLRLVSVPSEIAFCRSNVPAGAYRASGERWIQLLEALVLIQSKSSIAINLPDRDISYEEADHIFNVAHILATGHSIIVSKPIVVDTDGERVTAVLEQLRGGQSVRLHSLMGEGEPVNVCGSLIPLGPALVFQDCYLSTEEEAALELVIGGAAAGETIELRLTPCQDGLREARFLKWLPPEEAVALRTQYSHLFREEGGAGKETQ